MAEVADAFVQVFRNYVTDGLPGSGLNAPSKAEARALGSLIEQKIAQAVADAVAGGGAFEHCCVLPTGALTSGAGKYQFHLPTGVDLTEVRAEVKDPSISGAIQFDVNVQGVSIFSTPLTIDAGDATSVDAATPHVIATRQHENNSLVTIDVDAAGTGATDAKVWLIGARRSVSDAAIPYLVAYGTIDTETLDFTTSTNFPSGVPLLENDVAFMVLSYKKATGSVLGSIQRPSGWEAITENVTEGNTRWSLFYKRLAGGEEGDNQAVSVVGADGSGYLDAQIAVWRGCVENGDPYEAFVSNHGQGSAVTGVDILTLGANRLAVCMGSIYDENAFSDPDGDWVEAWDLEHAFTNFGSVQQAPAAASIPAEYRTISGSRPWATFTLALVPPT